MLGFKKSNRALGVDKGTRRYDLPLNKGSGGYFLRILIALMTFLAILALAASFALSAMTDRWTSGLSNQASVEISAENNQGEVTSAETLETLTQDVHKYLINHPAVENAVIMSEEEISKLVAPWLGDDMEFDNIPLPSILSVSFKPEMQFDKKVMAERLKAIAPQARLDTHESWLNDVLRFTGALNFAAILVTIVIGVTTIVAVGGAVQSRMAVYHEELELLHLMGASDHYISKQLQRYIFIVSLQGAIMGTIIGAVALIIIGWFAGQMDISLIPDFSLTIGQIGLLIALAPLIAILGMATARHTVLRVLSRMP